MSDRVPGIDGDLDLLFAQVNELRELTGDPDLDDQKIYAFKVRWGTMLAGRLQRLAYYREKGRLSADEAIRYEQLLADLRDALPLIDRFDLGPVGVPLDS